MPCASRRLWAGTLLHVSSWNDRGLDVEVKSLDLMSREAQSAPFILAITVE